MSQQDMDPLRNAIADELGLARDGIGYEEVGVADEIVAKYVTPLRAERDLLLWLHAEAVRLRDRDARELARWRSGQRWKSWPTVKAVPDGLAYAAALARAQGTEGGDEHDELLRQAAIRLRDMDDAARAALVNLERSEASRRDWAAEAERNDPPLATEDEVADIVAEFGNLNTFLTEQVTEKLFEFYDIHPKPTRQAESPGRYLCACLTPEGAQQVLSTGRFSLPLCAVHPEADR